MNTVNALKMRQNLGQVLDLLDAEGPVLIEKNRTPRAVLISLEDYKQKFLQEEIRKRRREVVERIRSSVTPWEGEQSIVETIREMRDERGRVLANRSDL